MLLGRVAGTVVATHKGPRLEGIRFLLVETINPGTMKGKGEFVVVMDGVGAGAGELVMYVTGSSARLTPLTEGKPTDASIMAIVDQMDLDGEMVYRKDGSPDPGRAS